MNYSNGKLNPLRLALALAAVLLCASAVCAQTTAFTYQGKLTDGGNPANGNYDLQFALFDSVSGGTQSGSTVSLTNVAVSGGVFTVQLDFGVNAFPGANRFLEIGVRPTGSSSFTTLAPRQQISSTPYAIRTLSAGTADALSSACVACVQDSQISSVSGSKVSGAIPVASVPAGSTSYIQNTTTQQASANFNISGNGTLGGTLSAGPVISNVSDNYGLKQTGGGISVGTFVGSGGGWLGTITNHPLYFFTNNGASPTMTVHPNGNVGIGTTSPGYPLVVQSSGLLSIYGKTTGSGTGIDGESTSGIGLQGVSQSGSAILGQSGTGFGVQGTSGSNTAVVGQSTGGVGVQGTTAAAHTTTTAAVVGTSTGDGGIGVLGLANTGDTWSVAGITSSPTGVGVYGQNTAGGRAMYAEGNVAQSINSYGIAKAMIYFDPISNSIVRCYNGFRSDGGASDPPSSHYEGTTLVDTGCGFRLALFASGNSDSDPRGYGIDFGFDVTQRFVSVTAESSSFPATAGFERGPNDNHSINVWINNSDGNEDVGFMIILF